MINIKYASMVELNKLKDHGTLNDDYNLTQKNKLKEFGKNAIEYLTLKEMFFNLQSKETLTEGELRILKNAGKYLNILEKKLSASINTKDIDITDHKVQDKSKKLSAEQSIKRELYINTFELFFYPNAVNKKYLNLIYPDKNNIPNDIIPLFKKGLEELTDMHKIDYNYFLNYSFKLYDILRKIYIVNGREGLIKFNELNNESLNSEYINIIYIIYSNDEILKNDELFDKYGENFSKFKDSIIINITSKESALNGLNTKNQVKVLKEFFFTADDFNILFENGEKNTSKIRKNAKFKDLTKFINIINIKTDTEIDYNTVDNYIRNVAQEKLKLPNNKRYTEKI